MGTIDKKTRDKGISDFGRYIDAQKTLDNFYEMIRLIKQYPVMSSEPDYRSYPYCKSK